MNFSGLRCGLLVVKLHTQPTHLEVKSLAKSRPIQRRPRQLYSFVVRGDAHHRAHAGARHKHCVPQPQSTGETSDSLIMKQYFTTYSEQGEKRALTHTRTCFDLVCWPCHIFLPEKALGENAGLVLFIAVSLRQYKPSHKPSSADQWSCTFDSRAH